MAELSGSGCLAARRSSSLLGGSGPLESKSKLKTDDKSNKTNKLGLTEAMMTCDFSLKIFWVGTR